MTSESEKSIVKARTGAFDVPARVQVKFAEPEGEVELAMQDPLTALPDWDVVVVILMVDVWTWVVPLHVPVKTFSGAELLLHAAIKTATPSMTSCLIHAPWVYCSGLSGVAGAGLRSARTCHGTSLPYPE
jgi:hypothetical protein